MRLHTLQPAPGAKSTRKRVGRGTSSGQKRGFEGGQTPLYKKLPKIMRFKNYPFKIEYEVVNVEKLNRFESGSVVDIGTLVDTGLVSSLSAKVKILGQGEITKPLQVKVHAISKSAKEKIEAAGGSVEVVD